MGAPGMEKALKSIQKWMGREEWRERTHQIVAGHLAPACDDFDIDLDDLAEVIGPESCGMAVSCALDDLLTCDFEPDDRNVVDDYIKRRGWKESVSAKRCLQAMRESVMSLYEVTATVPGSHLIVKDLVRGGDPIRVEDRRGSTGAVKWDRLGARVVRVNGKNYLSPGILRFSLDGSEDMVEVLRESSAQVQREFQEAIEELGVEEVIDAKILDDAVVGEMAPMFTRFWLNEILASVRQPLPMIVNFDGDELVLCEVRFPVPGANAAEIERRLDGAAELERDDEDARFWQWVGDGSVPKRKAKGGSGEKGFSFGSFDERGRLSLGMVEMKDRQLILSVNSDERAESGKELLRDLLGGLVGQSRTAFQNLESLSGGGDRSEELAADEIPPEVAVQIVREYLDRHYRHCISDKIPMLDGKTPRQAARSKSGRAKLVQWLKYIENGETRRATDQEQEPYDLGWMWSELGVSELREQPRS